MEKRVNVKIRGLVQGVGFRMFIVREAAARNLSGWTRNQPDGSVEFEAQGPAGLVDDLVRQVNIGPSKSRVTSLAVRDIGLSDDSGSGFGICY
jgi:acylphosphatase